MSVETHHRDSSDVRIRCAVVTCSDTRTPDTDESGRLICDLLTADGHELAARKLITDDTRLLSATLDELIPAADAVLITGGTGLSPRDGAADVVEGRLDRALPGFGELFRMLSFEEIGAAAMLSRAVAGTSDGAFVASLPGSKAAVRLAMERLILPELRHIIGQMRG
jgi:molybdenum cofactor biosynthesis protein B